MDKHVYLIQDSTFYNYTNHKAKIDVGNIGKQHRHTQFGFMQYTALGISAQDVPLDILELDFIGYEDEKNLFLLNFYLYNNNLKFNSLFH